MVDDFQIGGVRQTTWTNEETSFRLVTFPQGEKWIVQLMKKDRLGWQLEDHFEFLTFAGAVDKHDEIVSAVKSTADDIVRRAVLLAMTSIGTGLLLAGAMTLDGLWQWVAVVCSLLFGATAFYLQFSEP